MPDLKMRSCLIGTEKGRHKKHSFNRKRDSRRQPEEGKDEKTERA
jgi:hypothetical protein